MAITLRSIKGSPLTQAEMDTNFDELDKKPSGQVYPKTSGIGIQIDNASPDWGWHDLRGHMWADDQDANRAMAATYRGNLKAFQFIPTTTDMLVDFHLPHDYAMGTNLFIHAHWSHNSTLVTGGSVTWGFELMYAQGHDQGAFTAPILVPVTQNASTTQYQHMIAETALSVSGGSANQLDTDIIEVDGLVLGRIYLDSNDLTVSGGGVPDPFLHFVDIHYQSSGLPTKQKAPDFWT